MSIFLLVLLWYALGLIGAGFAVAQFYTKDDEFQLWSDVELKRKKRQSTGWAICWAIGGPLVLVLGFLLTGFGQYGWWNVGRRPRKRSSHG